MLPLAFSLQRGNRGLCDDLPSGAGTGDRQGKKSVSASCPPIQGPTTLRKQEKEKGRQTTQGISCHFWASRFPWVQQYVDEGVPGAWLAPTVWGSEVR